MRYIDRLVGACPVCRWRDDHNADCGCDGAWWAQVLAAIGQAPVLCLIDRVERGEIEARPSGVWEEWGSVSYWLDRWEIEVYLDGPGTFAGFGDWHYLMRVAFDGVWIRYEGMPYLVGNYVPDDDCALAWHDPTAPMVRAVATRALDWLLAGRQEIEPTSAFMFPSLPRARAR